MKGAILNIYIANSACADMIALEQAQLEAGKGIRGDRYYSDTGTFSQRLRGKAHKELTLVEAEALDAFNEQAGLSIDYGAFRRNVVTTGIRLNDLVGKEFTIDGVRLKGIKLCEPCAHLAEMLSAKILPGLVGKGGLRAAILTSGAIRPGDTIEVAKGSG